MQVKKRDGTLEAFMPEKIVVSIVKSGAPYEMAQQIAATITKRKDKVIQSSAIKDIILGELGSHGQSAAVAHWRQYDQTKTHT